MYPELLNLVIDYVYLPKKVINAYTEYAKKKLKEKGD
jgi:hypothetical protein